MHQHLIKDQNDQSGYGMFSKAGRFTTEKYRNAFSQVKSLFADERSKSVTNDDEDLKSNAEDNQSLLKDNQKVIQPQSPGKKVEKKDQPFSKYMSREKAQSVNFDKDNAPPCGYYTPKYTYIFRGPKLVLDFSKQPCKTQDDAGQSQSFLSPDKPKRLLNCYLFDFRKIKGYYNISKMLSRSVYQHTDHDQSYNDKNRSQAHVRQVDFGKQLERNTRPQTSPCQNFPYDKNYKNVHKSITIEGPDFSKACTRKPNINKWNCINTQNHFEYDQFNTSLTHSKCFPKQNDKQLIINSSKKSIPNFLSMINREKDPQSTFPGFMQKNINTRMMLTTLNQKMLEENCYASIDQGPFRKYYSRKLKSRS